MPFYAVNGMRMHIKWGGRGKPPAPCVAKVGVGPQQHQCCDISAFLCDWPVAEGCTCDAPLCNAHAHQVGKNKHYCPRHLQEAQQPGANMGTHQPSLFGLSEVAR